MQMKIEGDVSGQVIMGNHNVQINADNGALVSVQLPGEPPTPYPKPIKLLPAAFHGLLDRTVELDVAVNALKSNAPVGIYGEQGAGKTALLRLLAHSSDWQSFPDGVAYFPAAGHSESDLSNELFKIFYDVRTNRSFKPTVVELLHLMKEKRGLILLDDVELTRDELQRAIGCAPACAFVVASQSRLLWGEGQPLEMKGLPVGDAVTLFERGLGRALSEDERAAAESLCSRLKCHPQRILEEAELINKEGRAVVEAAAELPTASAGKRLLDLTNTQDRNVLSAIAALDGASAHADHLSAICGPESVGESLRQMESRGLVQSQYSRYSVKGDLAEALAAEDLTSWKERWLSYFIEWAERNRRSHDLLIQEAIAIQSLLRWAVEARRWEDVIRLTRALESALILGGRWDAWQQTLQWMLKAGKALGRSTVIGFALHQLGTRALGLGQKDAAKSYLEEALKLRQSLGDEAGAAVTRNNLNLLLKPLPVIPARRGRMSSVATRVLKWALLPIALLITGLLIFWRTPPAQPVSLDRDSLDFPIQLVNTPSQPKAVTITNGHSKEKRISLSITGEHASDFRMVNDPCSQGPIAPNSTCAVSIIFTPSATGNRAATLVLAESGTQHKVRLSGTGMPPTENVSVSVSPESLSFIAEIGSESEPQRITVANAGSKAVNINFNADGPGASGFNIVSECRRAIASGQSCDIIISFKPAEAADYHANLTIVDDEGNPLRGGSLKGTGIAKIIPPGNMFVLTPTPVKFDDTEVENSSREKYVYVENRGEGLLKIGDAFIADGDKADFEVSRDECPELPPNSRRKCAFKVKFTPKQAGTRSARLIIPDEAGNTLPVLLSGMGTQAEIKLSKPLLDFGARRVGSPGANPLIINVTNIGSAPLRLTDLAKKAGDFTISSRCASNPIAPNATCSIEVIFLPTSFGEQSTTITISSNARSGPQTVTLRGTGKEEQRVWCCKNNEVFISTDSKCRENGGRPFDNKGEADRACKREDVKGWCCILRLRVNRTIRSSFFAEPTLQQQCNAFEANKSECNGPGVRFFLTREEACRNRCLPKPYR